MKYLLDATITITVESAPVTLNKKPQNQLDFDQAMSEWLKTRPQLARYIETVDLEQVDNWELNE